MATERNLSGRTTLFCNYDSSASKGCPRPQTVPYKRFFIVGNDFEEGMHPRTPSGYGTFKPSDLET